MKTQYFSKKRVQRGATMIEVLIAILIFSVGLLGIASTQTMGLTNTQSALNRSIATQLAYDLVDIMRLNQDVVELGAFANGGLFDSYQTISNAGVQNPSNYALVDDCNDATKGCTAVQLAQTELESWRQKIVRSLPDGQARVDLANAAEGLFTVVMTWKDIKSGAAIEANDAAIADAGYDDELTNIAGTDDSSIFRFEMDFRP